MPEPALTTAAAKPTMFPLPKRRRRSEFLDVCDKKIENKKKRRGTESRFCVASHCRRRARQAPPRRHEVPVSPPA